MKTGISILLMIIWSATVYGQKSQSVLSSGAWYKMAVMSSGVHKIDYDFVVGLGINPEDINPDYLAIYGNANNGMLPQPNDAKRTDDLLENAILGVGLEDGKFDRGDYFIFYGKSADHLNFDSENSSFSFQKNIYSDTSFYYLTIKNEPSKRISIATKTDNVSFANTYLNMETHEVDENVIINSGREWFGEKFTGSELTHQITYSSANITPNSTIKVFVSLLSRAKEASSFTFKINGQNLGETQMTPISEGAYITQADVQIDTFSIHSNSIDMSNGLTLDISFDPGQDNSVGFLDYAHIVSQKRLDASNGNFEWYKNDGETGYEISGQNLSVWNISSMTSPIAQSSSISESVFKFTSDPASSHFIAFAMTQLLEPHFDRKIKNQNLHGMGAMDGVIITNSVFLKSARRLAAFRTAFDGLLIETVTVDQIYNEFSSGSQDVTALRDFVKLQYDKHGQKLKYVLLFGDCSFDYKGRSINETNFVPIYESRNSLHPINSYSSDDYFGFMEDSEGQWEENQSGDHTMDIGVGRIPIQSNDAGEAVVNKIIRYQTNPLGYGRWRNKVVFVADDGDSNIHQEDADKLATYVDTIRHELNVDKIYLDAYPQDQNPNRSPLASEAFLAAISHGSIIVNFTGHGNEGKLTDENIFNELMISDLKNNIVMPFFITATCQFGNYDNPNRISGGEQMVLLPHGGAVAMLTSTRPVYSNSNYNLNKAFYFAAMAKGQFKRLGDIIKETKNTSLQGSRNRNYALLGDPSMRLMFPQIGVGLTHINGKTLDDLDTLNALGKYKLEGQIQQNRVLKDDYSGEVSVTVFDKPSKFRTLGNKQTVKQVFDIRDVRLFQGAATVTDGKFSIEFIIPKNIDYSYEEGKINFYAVNSSINMDAHGSYSEVIIGGSENIAEEEKNPPKIELYLNNTEFLNGGTIGSSALLLAKLSDESGINISNAGFGNNISLYLDDNESKILNSYYEASLDTYKEGWVTYPLDNLEIGLHSLVLEASDILNNESEVTIEFYVTDKNEIKLTSVINYPNPINIGTVEATISFEHDRLGEELDTWLVITTLGGREILSNYYRLDNVSDTKLELKWDLRNASGGKVDKGIYVYKLIVQSAIDGSKSSAHRKIVILN